jgi:D-alanyl-D-alanine carboxypeptidase/D-alanyl-D-alanine-endopeptidase (penicillin-binding protein 4)
MRTTIRRPRVRNGLVGAALTAGLVTAGPAASGVALPAAAVTAHASLASQPVAASTYVVSTADRRISSALSSRVSTTRFGTAFTGAVLDAGSGRLLWSKNGSTGRMPASTAKLVTATNALAAFGSSHRFTTTVRRGYQADQVFLVGSGDPDLSSGQLAVLALATATRMKAAGQTRVRVYADDYLFAAPTLATGWKASYIPADTTWLRALVVDRHDVTDTAIDAANVFAGQLRANGITVTRIGRGRAGVGPVLASSAGVTLGSTISHMMLTSDNEHAEALHRLVGIRAGYGNTWSAARAAQQQGLAAQGLSATALYDGSGLSRSDRLTGVQLARVVANAFEPANATRLALLRSNAGLPVSGQTGTLQASYGRFTTAASKCAVGKVHAKTGSLGDVVSLAGWTVGTDGRVKTFAFVVNGRSDTLALRQSVDMLAATVNGCY